MHRGRIRSLDLLRGIAIIVVLIVHRLHYHWAGMASRDSIRAQLAGPLVPFVVVLIALFTMAGVFYFVSGFANAYSLIGRLHEGTFRRAAAVRHAVAAGVWLVCLSYLHRVFLTNGFAEGEGGREPTFPAGLLTGLVRHGTPVPFRWSLVTEPGTLALIGLIAVVIGIVLGLLPRRQAAKPRLRRCYLTLGMAAVSVVVAAPVLELHCRPSYDVAYASGRVLEAALLGFLCQKFGLFPYLSFGLVGAVLGLATAEDRSPRALRRWAGAGAIALFSAAAVAIVLVDRHSGLGRRILGVSLSCAELALFVALWLVLSRFFDRGTTVDPLHPAQPAPEQNANWLCAGIRRFGLVALTVYTLEPLVAEILKHPVDLLFGRDWVHEFWLVLTFGLTCVAAWWVLLAAWEKRRYRGSLECLSARFVGRSCRIEPPSRAAGAAG